LWWRGGQLVQPDDPDDFFDEVFFDRQVKAPARWRDRQTSRCFGKGQPKALEHISALGLCDGHAQHFGCALHA
jgi:hypothetical protein